MLDDTHQHFHGGGGGDDHHDPARIEHAVRSVVRSLPIISGPIGYDVCHPCFVDALTASLFRMAALSMIADRRGNDALPPETFERNERGDVVALDLTHIKGITRAEMDEAIKPLLDAVETTLREEGKMQETPNG